MPGPSSPPFVSVCLAHRRPSWRRVARVVVVLLVVLAVAALVTAGVMWQYAARRLDTAALPHLEHAADASPAPLAGARNVLVVGTDVRDDTIVVVHTSPAQPDALLVAFPHDLKVNIAGEGVEHLAAARTLGGPDLLVRTIEEYSGIEVDHYVQVDLSAVADVVDVVGGVEVCDADEECEAFDGAAAAAYVRPRDDDPLDGSGRIERQEHMTIAIAGRLATAATMVNPIRLKRVIDVVTRSIVTDDAVGTRTIMRTTGRLRDTDPARSRVVTIPGETRSQGGVEYFVAEPEAAETIFQAIRDGEVIAATPTPPPSPPTPSPQDVSVRVLNGAGVADLATRVGAELATAGFQVVEVGNAETYGLALTELRYAPGHEADAGLLAGYFPGATSVESEAVPDDTDVVVVLGTDQADRP